jgi:hypothetical protein
LKDKQKTKIDNGKEHVRLTKTPSKNLMLDRQVLKIEERLMGHRSFLPQKVVWWDIWIGVLQKKHSSK